MLNDLELGKCTYHKQRFFSAECSDPFLPPSWTFAGHGARTTSTLRSTRATRTARRAMRGCGCPSARSAKKLQQVGAASVSSPVGCHE
ncbi:hypothetical protein C8Q80DRAFT_1177078 [Daedaleopsis nitida]|nr:hypothetical protein C8Q80DRAFT_1177078 [Daedaleopsis nitida]